MNKALKKTPKYCANRLIASMKKPTVQGIYIYCFSITENKLKVIAGNKVKMHKTIKRSDINE